MNFEFKVYQSNKRSRKQEEPFVVVKPNGRIVFNKPASEVLEGKPFCILASDTANKAIGVMPVENQEPNAFSIRNTAKGAYVGAKKFLKATGLLPGAIVKQVPIRSGEYIAIKL